MDVTEGWTRLFGMLLWCWCESLVAALRYELESSKHVGTWDMSTGLADGYA